MSGFSLPRPIAPTDDVSAFRCGEPTLDEWLRRRALRNERAGASRTFVSSESLTGRIAGYYCLSASSIRPAAASGAVRRNMPDPIPVILLGRLAVDEQYGARGVGASLLQDAATRSVQAARAIGARALLVDAISDSAERFYQRFGFSRLSGEGRRLYLLLTDAEKTLASIG